jgi:serine/threonine protein kinase
MTLNNAAGQTPDGESANKRAEGGHAPPTRAHLASLMAQAEESSPHSEQVQFELSDGSEYLLTVTYLIPGIEPTWVLSTEGEDPPVVFWSVTTENPEQIYNLVQKRARNPSIRPAPQKHLIDTDEDHNPHAQAKEAPELATKSPENLFLDRYEVIEEIGCGGMSRVYKAKDRKQDRMVAVKVLHPHLLSENKIRKKKPEKRFQQEFKATMALAHLNIVAVIDHGETSEGLPFMVMEFIDGPSLEQIFKDHGRLKLSHFMTIFYQVCSALSHAHIRGVIHRDVKPSNIMLVKTPQNVELVKLLDFGIAKIEPQGDETSQKLTQTGDVFGSPYYMSPEQCKGGQLDARSDIYSLGCVMYQAVTGKRPFEGDNAYKTIYMHVNVKAAPFSTSRPESSIPSELEAIIMKCLEKEPHMRYQTAQALSLDLQKLARGDRDEEDYITKQTRSGTFYAVHPNTGKEQPANFLSVIKLLKQAGLITDAELQKAVLLDERGRSELGNYLVASGIIDGKTLHSAVELQGMLERDVMKVEKAIIALHYCQRSRISLEEALEELGWKTGAT